MNTTRLTTFFASLGYTIPWSRITLREVAKMPITAILCPTSNAVTVAWWGHYWIDYLEGDPEPVIAHELCHVMQMERDPLYIVKYAYQLVTKGYSNVSYEIDARALANKYALWEATNGH